MMSKNCSPAFSLRAFPSECWPYRPPQAPSTSVRPELRRQPSTKVLKSPVDDQYVLLSGKITSQVSKDKYTFTDKTGSIVVEIDNEVFAGRQVGPDTQVEIWGKVDKDMFKEPKIDVKRLGIPNQTK